MGAALKDAYGDLFVLRSNPTDADRPLLEGKFKSAHNVSDRVAKLQASTFYGLLALADLVATRKEEPVDEIKVMGEESKKTKRAEHDEATEDERSHVRGRRPSATFHYNIQIHLPATKDIEVYSAIFKSLKEHLVE